MPRYGVIEWQASPTSVTRPRDQVSRASRTNRPQRNRFSEWMNRSRMSWCQPSKSFSASASSPRSDHDSVRQTSLSTCAEKLTNSSPLRCTCAVGPIQVEASGRRCCGLSLCIGARPRQALAPV